MEQRDDEIDLMTNRAHSARVYDYYLGGKTNYAADREVGDAALAVFPTTRVNAQMNRAFMQRAVHHLAVEHGIRQFLDIGTGIPTAPNVHQVAQSVAADARVVYVDNDPIVLAHARALLIGTPQGRTEYVDADLREPQAILEAPQLRDVLDLRRPIALTMFALLHFIEDDEEAHRVVRHLLDALPSASYLALTCITEGTDPVKGAAVREQYRSRGIPLRARSLSEIEGFCSGLQVLEPGVVKVHEWRPEGPGLPIGLRDDDIGIVGVVARKP